MVNSKVGHADPMPQHQQQQQTKNETKVAYFYREGDHHFAPCKVIISRRKYGNLTALMGDLGGRVKLPRGVRAIFTPKGRHLIENLDQIENEGSYVCSSHIDRGVPVDVHHMQVDPQPFVTARPKADYMREDSRYIRTGLPADEPSDEELTDVKSRLKRKQEIQKIERLKTQEKMRGKDQSWAERVRRIILIRNGDPEVTKHYLLTTATATNVLKVKADLSAMFGLPVERIYTFDGRLILDVEDLFRSDSSAFVVSFGEHFKTMSGYLKYANIQERELARMAGDENEQNKASKKAEAKGSRGPEPLRRFDTVVLPPLERSFSLPKAPTFSEPIRKRAAPSLPPLPKDKLKPAKRSREAPETSRPAPLAPAFELPAPTRLRSKTMVIDKPRKVQFAQDSSQGPVGKPSQKPGGNTNAVTAARIGDTRRSKLGNSDSGGEQLPVVLPSFSGNPGLKPSDRNKSTSDAALNNHKKKRLQRSTSEILAEVQALSKKAQASIKNNKVVAQPLLKQKATGFVKMRKSDKQAEVISQVWEVRITTGDLPAGVSTISVTLTAYGAKGKSNAFSFTPAKKVFMPRSVEHFTVKLPNLGDIYKIRIESNDAGPNPDWRCDNVIMENGHSGERLEFPCKRWLSSNFEDRQIVREIPSLSEARAPIPLINYDVIVHTGNVWNASTLGTVSLEVHGERGDTGRRILKHSNHGVPFARGQVDIFPLECVSLGEVRFIRLKHDPGASGVGWFVENVVLRVREFDLHSQFIFPLSRWLNMHEDDGLLEVEVRPVDLAAYMRMQDAHMWPFERWKFTLPDLELMFYSCNSKKPLRITSGGFIDGRSEAVDVSDGYAVFNVINAENLGRENTVSLRTVAIKSPAFVAFSQRKVVAKAEYSASCDLRIHVLPSRAINLESEKFPNNYVSVLPTGQLQLDVEAVMPGPAQAFFCYVKGCFRDGGIIMLCTSKIQTLCVEKDPSILTALGKRNRLAHFRVHKVTAQVRKFESVVFTGCYLQIRKGVCNAAGNGDRYCEFRVRRNREQNYVTLESLRDRGCFVGSTNTGSVYPLVDNSSSHPNAWFYPEIIELGRRKMPIDRSSQRNTPANEYGGRSRKPRSEGSFKNNNRPHLEQPMHKPPHLSNGHSSRQMTDDEEGDESGARPGQSRVRAARSPYRSQVRRPNSKRPRPKPKPKPVEGTPGRFDQLSKPPARMVNARKPPTPKKKPTKAPPPPRVATLPPKKPPPKKREDGDEDKEEEHSGEEEGEEEKNEDDEDEERKEEEEDDEDDENDAKKKPPAKKPPPAPPTKKPAPPPKKASKAKDGDDDNEEDDDDSAKKKPAPANNKKGAPPPPPKKPASPPPPPPKGGAKKPAPAKASSPPPAKKEPPPSNNNKKAPAQDPAPAKKGGAKEAPTPPAAKKAPAGGKKADEKPSSPQPPPKKGQAAKDTKDGNKKDEDDEPKGKGKDKQAASKKDDKSKAEPAKKGGNAKKGDDDKNNNKKNVKFADSKSAKGNKKGKGKKKEEEEVEEEKEEPPPEKPKEQKKNCVIS